MKFIKRTLFILIIGIIIVGSIFILNGMKMYEDAISKTSLKNTVQAIQNSKNYVKLDKLPQNYINAVIAVEDHRYKEHGAIDPIAIRTSYMG